MLVEIKSQHDLETRLNDAAAKGGGLVFDGSVAPVDINGTVEVRLKDLGEVGAQFMFNGLRLNSTNGDGVTPCIRFIGNTKRLTIADLNVFGGAYASAGCGNGVEVMSEGGAVWLSTFRNIQSSWCRAAGIRVQGEVFESAFYSLDVKDNYGHGIEFSNASGVISNCMVYGTNASRNVKAGVALLDGCGSVDLIGGSMISNGSCGIDAGNGIRNARYINGENTGETLIRIPFSAYPSQIVGCNMSSSGIVNPYNPDNKPAQYVIMGATQNVMDRDCYVTPYGANPPEMSVRAPASRAGEQKVGQWPKQPPSRSSTLYPPGRKERR